MDPPEETLSQIGCVGHACALAGMIPANSQEGDGIFPGALCSAFYTALGVNHNTPIEVLAANEMSEVHS